LPVDLRERGLTSTLASRALAIEMMRGSSGRACSAVNRRLMLAGFRPTRRASSAFERLGSGRACGEPSTMRAVELMAESQLRAELMAEHYRVESKQWFVLYQGN
jgi:hypothetical protein